MTTALLLGAGGMLGTAIAGSAPASVRVVARSRAQCDIADPSAIARALDESQASCVINAAAYTNVDRAESDEASAAMVNARAVGSLGEQCAARQIPLVHYSTDYVFSGEQRRPYREEDPAQPVNVYGRTKLDGERALMSVGGSVLLIRVQALFGSGGRSFPAVMWARATARVPTTVVSDQRTRPTRTHDVAMATWTLLERGATGVYHVSGSGDATWYDVAARIFERAGSPGLVHACTSEAYGAPAPRPAFSVLDPTRLKEKYGVTLPDWRHSLDEFLSELETPSA